ARGWSDDGWGGGAWASVAVIVAAEPQPGEQGHSRPRRSAETTSQCRGLSRNNGGAPGPLRVHSSPGAPPLFRGVAVCSGARLLQGICDGHFDLGEDLRSEEVAAREGEDGESCIGDVHAALVVLASGGVRAGRVHVVSADDVNFHDDGSFIMPEVVPADEFACRRMSRELGHHARDAVAVELDRAECLGRGLVEFAGQLEGQPCSVEAAYSWGQTGLDRLVVNTVVVH